jgi:hypothetical protein
MLKNFSKEEFDIVVQAGQSNSEGTGFGSVVNPYIANENVWYLNQDFTISLATEKVQENMIQGNYSLSFADKYINNNLLVNGRKLLILRCSVGGTGFLDNRWGPKDDLFLKMMEMIKTALELNSSNKLVAFLWHQGETDAMLNADYNTHYTNLYNLINAVKEEYGYSNLPFVAGDFVKHWKDENILICEPVINAIKDVCENCNGEFVETSDLLSNAQTFDYDDTIHFSRESLYKLGVLYFNAFLKLKSN